MEWIDDAIVLSARPHGESAAVAMLLTREHGCHAGLVPGGRTSRQRGVLQPGSLVTGRWRARLPEHLGTYSLELERAYAAGLLDDGLRLSALAAVCAVAELALPERQPHRPVFEGMAALLDMLESPVWAEAYVRWELGVLRELGFGLDLTRCAATGGNDQLAYVSPRTGRAVSLSAGADYRGRLLPLPGFLVGQGRGGPREVLDGLMLTGYFLERHAFNHADKGHGHGGSARTAQRAGFPPARDRFVQAYRKRAALSVSLPPP